MPKLLVWICTSLLGNLGHGLRDRYKRTGNLADLEAAITASQQAVQATWPDAPNLPMDLTHLGNRLDERYDRTGEPIDLETAITAFQQAVQAAPSDSPSRPRYWDNLGNRLRTRYTRTGELADLEAAITLHRQAVQITPPNSPDLPRYLTNLASGLHERYDHTGELADLEAAITSHRQALQAISSDSPIRFAILTNLGNGLKTRYERTGELADLEAAITSHRQALQVISSDSPEIPNVLNNIGGALGTRYERTGELADLKAAITSYRQAVQATPPDSPDLPARLNNLGSGWHQRYERTRELAALEASITAFQQAIRTIPSSSPELPAPLSNLGGALMDRYIHAKDLTDLETAIAALQQAVQATPPDSPDLPARLNNLGNGLHARYERAGNLADLEAAIMAWEESWSIPQTRFTTLPVTYQLGQQHQRIHVAARLVTAYLEQANHRPHARNVLRRTLEIAEGSKSRLLTQLVGRGPLPLPDEISPEIATREWQLLAKLTTLDAQELAIHDFPDTTQEGFGYLQRLQQRQAILHELEDLWTHIAQVNPKGIEYVALRRGTTPTWQELAHLANDLGPATALLSFFTATDRALLFLLRADWRAPRLVEISLNQSNWADLLERFFHEVPLYSPGQRRGETWEQLLRPLFTKAQHHLEHRSRNAVLGKPVRGKPGIVPLLGELKRESEGGDKLRPKEGCHLGDLRLIAP